MLSALGAPRRRVDCRERAAGADHCRASAVRRRRPRGGRPQLRSAIRDQRHVRCCSRRHDRDWRPVRMLRACRQELAALLDAARRAGTSAASRSACRHRRPHRRGRSRTRRTCRSARRARRTCSLRSSRDQSTRRWTSRPRASAVTDAALRPARAKPTSGRNRRVSVHVSLPGTSPRQDDGHDPEEGLHARRIRRRQDEPGVRGS